MDACPHVVGWLEPGDLFSQSVEDPHVYKVIAIDITGEDDGLVFAEILRTGEPHVFLPSMQVWWHGNRVAP